MKYRPIGQSGMQVPEIGFGCMGLTGTYGEMTETQAMAALEAAWSNGIRLYDTADRYGDGDNERLLGRFLRGMRSEAVVVTKCGLLAETPRGRSVPICNDPEYLKRACYDSLERLQTNYIDVLILHRLDPLVPIEESIGALSELVEEGRVLQVGLSEASSETVRRAAEVHPITAVENEYSLWSRDIEGDVLPVCEELGISLFAFSPLGRGFLSGGIATKEDLANNDLRLTHPRFSEDNIRRNSRLVAALREIAQRYEATCSQIALSWLLMQSERIIPIPGTSNPRHTTENVKSSGIQLLNDDQQVLDRIFRSENVSGDRYSPAAMKMVDAGSG